MEQHLFLMLDATLKYEKVFDRIMILSLELALKRKITKVGRGQTFQLRKIGEMHKHLCIFWENICSLGKRDIDPFRSSLTPQIVEALECTSDWPRAEQPNFYREPTNEELELYQTCEELERETAHMTLVETPLNSTTTAGQ
ncbi:hypothetical protein M0R45_014842 [Rubus argutus]|uniref:Uncharacterized protein n=1 Tax=Rubus argutus TaxID=59490 RepID=A0AAW1XPY5_RUBAR